MASESNESNRSSAYLQSKVSFGKAASSFTARLFVHGDVRTDRLSACSSRIEDVVEVLHRLRTLRLLAGLRLDHVQYLRIAEPFAHVEAVRRTDEEAVLIEAGAHATAVGLQIGWIFIHFDRFDWSRLQMLITGTDHWLKFEIASCAERVDKV